MEYLTSHWYFLGILQKLRIGLKYTVFIHNCIIIIIIIYLFQCNLIYRMITYTTYSTDIMLTILILVPLTTHILQYNYTVYITVGLFTMHSTKNCFFVQGVIHVSIIVDVDIIILLFMISPTELITKCKYSFASITRVYNLTVLHI